MAGLYIVLMGVQGSGKGTQAAELEKHYQIPHVSTGVLFRAMKQEGTALGKQIGAIMDAGQLVSDDLTIQAVRDRLKRGDAANGVIFDGFPRNLAQAQALDALLKEFHRQVTLAPYLALSADRKEEQKIALSRIADRWECSLNSKHVYNLNTNPPQVPGRCDIDDAPLKQRGDDTPEAAARRLNDFYALTLPLLDYYRNKQVLREINANQPIKAVTADLIKVIDGAQTSA